MSIRFSIETMNEMEAIISSFIKQENINIKIPVDIFDIATKLGFDVRGAEFKDTLEGILIVDERIEKIPSFNSNKIIAYNCKKDINSKKFIVAHELAHYINEKNSSQDASIVYAARDHEELYSNDIEEQKMDYMAAALLIPKNDLLKNFSIKSKNKGEMTQKIASKYNVTIDMAARRIEEVFHV